MTWYTLFWPVAKGITLALTRLTVSGRSHIPRRGPFFLIANHQSVLDPVIVQSSILRSVHSFTKSTQFSSGPAMRWLMLRLNGIPTRRYRVDPQVVRVALRLLKEGRAVGIYVEGERSWDGSLQPFRQGAIRLILKAGVPVVPCRLNGTFEVWPRWSRKPRRGRVSVRFGRPLHFGAHDTRAEREAVLDETTARLRQALIDLDGTGETRRPRRRRRAAAAL